MSKKTIVLIPLTIMSIIFTSCGDWSVSEVYIQKIEGSSKVLYKYAAWGGRDSHVSGYSILDSSEIFRVDLQNRLNFLDLKSIPTKKLIQGIEHDGSDYVKAIHDNYKPIKTTNFEKQGFRIEVKQYQYRGYSNHNGGLDTYNFENFKETRDSLYFYNLDDVESVQPNHQDVLKFKKTNVYIDRNELNNVSKITINDLQLTDVDEIISSRTYFLRPKKIISINMFSDYGVFKRVILKKDNAD